MPDSNHHSPPIPTGLTPNQRACLDAIQAYFQRTRAMPSVEDLRVALGFSSKRGALRLLRQLEERGHIARVPLRARAIRLLHTGGNEHCERTASGAVAE